MPVVVLLIPTDDDGLLVAERGIDPKKGYLALTSGFMELGETPAETGAREHMEETGIAIDPQELEWFDFSKKHELLLIFLRLKRPLTKAEVASFVPTKEAVQIQVIYSPETLAFSSHTAMVAKYFASRRTLKQV
jgi:ADP-ribose pyrophosphatase YjhB (NUDIX family)